MEHRRKARPRTTASRIDLPEEQQASPFLISSYPNIDEFTEHGQIVIVKPLAHKVLQVVSGHAWVQIVLKQQLQGHFPPA